jgi:hypothetical protein
LKGLPARNISSQSDFDEWHKEACERLQKLYHEDGFQDFFVGQAQKWLNMSLKYVFAMGDERVPGFASIYPYAHIPIDNIFLQRVAKIPGSGIPELTEAWSRLKDYQEYLEYQQACRNWFRDSAPLSAEFWLWMCSES